MKFSKFHKHTEREKFYTTFTKKFIIFYTNVPHNPCQTQMSKCKIKFNTIFFQTQYLKLLFTKETVGSLFFF